MYVDKELFSNKIVNLNYSNKTTINRIIKRNRNNRNANYKPHYYKANRKRHFDNALK